MRKWRVDTVLCEKLADHLNEIEGMGGKIQQILAAINPYNVYVVWFTTEK